MSVSWTAWADRRADEVTLSRKGAKSRTGGRKLRSTGTKAGTRAGQKRQPRADLEQQLERYNRELTEAQTQLAEAREQLAEALEQQTASSEVLGVISGWRVSNASVAVALRAMALPRILGEPRHHAIAARGRHNQAGGSASLSQSPLLRNDIGDREQLFDQLVGQGDTVADQKILECSSAAAMPCW
jgi:hypothetical protein